MGGKVFRAGAHALRAPRMTQEIYDLMKTKCVTALNPVFKRVHIPIEPPEKASYGDIDVLVSLEGTAFLEHEVKDYTKKSIWGAIEQRLKPIATHRRNNMQRHMALPFPTLTGVILDRQMALEAAEAAEAKENEKVFEESAKTLGEVALPNGLAVESTVDEDDGPSDRCVQVDIRLCETDRELKWLSFKFAHGDWWNFLGTMIRPLGLTIDEKALNIRIPEIEKFDKKMARIPLTDSPDEVLEFLDLVKAKETFNQPFPSVDAMFDLAASSKWFLLWPPRQSQKQKQKQKQTQEESDKEDPQEQDDGAALRQRLGANEQHRLLVRPQYARFINEYLPRCYSTGVGVVSDKERTVEQVRGEVRQKAFDMFPAVQYAWKRKLAAWHRDRTRRFIKNEIIKNDVCLPKSIAPVLPKPQEGVSMIEIDKNWRGALRSALVKILLNEDGEEFLQVKPPKDLRDVKGVLVVDRVKDWITLNWQWVGQLAWRENCIRYAEAMERKRLAEAEAGAAVASDAGAAANEDGSAQSEGFQHGIEGDHVDATAVAEKRPEDISDVSAGAPGAAAAVPSA